MTGRRKSRRFMGGAPAASHNDAQQATSPAPEVETSSHYDLSGSADVSGDVEGDADFSFAPEEDNGDSSDSVLVAPVLPAKRTLVPKPKLNKGTARGTKPTQAPAAVSEATLSGDSDEERPAKRARAKKPQPTNLEERKFTKVSVYSTVSPPMEKFLPSCVTVARIERANFQVERRLFDDRAAILLLMIKNSRSDPPNHTTYMGEWFNERQTEKNRGQGDRFS
ncbi:hypothetical protein C8R43DRAFT_964114 [Mycena crocata]|nr:hypothetical protein C8R43DRAFT_964114 [Mycena crocata]